VGLWSGRCGVEDHLANESKCFVVAHVKRNLGSPESFRKRRTWSASRGVGIDRARNCRCFTHDVDMRWFEAS
jgi:hypothetical protein